MTTQESRFYCLFYEEHKKLDIKKIRLQQASYNLDKLLKRYRKLISRLSALKRVFQRKNTKGRTGKPRKRSSTY